MAIRQVPSPITIRDKEIVAKALLTDISAISFLKTSIRSLPRARLIMFMVAMARVLVLIPPPVDAGDAPIHIKNNVVVVVVNLIVSKFKVKKNCKNNF